MMIGPVSGIGGVGAAHASRQVSGAVATNGAGSTDFSRVLSDVASDAVNALKTGETTAIAGINGRASVNQVVEAVMNAEQALQTATALRDKLVAAYQEISRMAI